MYPALHWLVFTLYSNKQLWNNNIHQFLSSLHLGLHLYPFIEMEHLKPKLLHLNKYSIFIKTGFEMWSCGDKKGTNVQNGSHNCCTTADSTSLSTGKIFFLWDVWFSQTAVAQGKSWLQCMHFLYTGRFRLTVPITLGVNLCKQNDFSHQFHEKILLNCLLFF